MDHITPTSSCWEPHLAIKSSLGCLGSYFLEWLCAQSSACVARFMIWARQLNIYVSTRKTGWHRIKTYRTRLISSFQGWPVTSSICLANSLAIVCILLALSQVTCLICFINHGVSCATMMSQDLETYLVCDAKPLDDHEQGLPQLNTMMCAVHLCKPEQCCPDLPHAWWVLLCPWTSDCKVCVHVWCLPCIACHVDPSFNGITLWSCQLVLEECVVWIHTKSCAPWKYQLLVFMYTYGMESSRR